VLSNWEWLTDDGETEPEFYFPPMGHIWVRVEDYGVFMLTKCNHIMAECHTVLLPNARGKAVEIGKAALQWAFDNTSALRIITAVPETNPLALRMAIKSGFVQYGNNPKSFQKNNILYDQVLLGINKGELICPWP
jgi:RimJ/RimL family protein N-acetyltransferase